MAFIVIMVPITLVILVLSFIVVFAVTIPLAFVLEVVGVPPDASNALVGIVAIVGGLGLTFVLTVKAARRLPVIGEVVMSESSSETESAAPEPGRRRRDVKVVLDEVAELDARLARGSGGDDA